MTRYAAFLRGVSPMNAKMPELERSFEEAGFEDVATVLSSGNVVFSARAASATSLQRKCEAAMQKRLGRSFMTIVRPVDMLQELLASDPYASFRVANDAKRIVTFLRESPGKEPALPIAVDGAKILRVEGAEVFSVYVPSPKAGAFMGLIEKTFGVEVTTRTWATVEKVVRRAMQAAEVRVASKRSSGAAKNGSTRKSASSTRTSASDVEGFMSSLDHPRKAEIEALRKIILGVDRRIEESIKWNAPSFAIGEHFATFKLRPAETIQVVFHTGAKVKPGGGAIEIDDPRGLLKWAAKDRCVATLTDLADIRAKKAAFQTIVKQWIAQLEGA
jgi:uncharacterized protein (DUF1697 family)